jgi:hypothetical protein
MTDKHPGDINDALDEIRPKDNASGWRMTTKDDVFYAGVGVLVIAVMLAYRIIDPEDSVRERTVFGLLWAVVLAFQARSFRIVLQKYWNGEDIQTGFFRDVTKKREK